MLGKRRHRRRTPDRASRFARTPAPA